MAKKHKKPRKQMQVWKIYDSKTGTLARKTTSCPKCGPGVFLAKHKDRKSCGRCGYTEMAKKQ